MKCYSSVKVLKETAEAMGIVINDLETKGYETLIYKQAANVWEEKTSSCCYKDTKCELERQAHLLYSRHPPYPEGT